MHIGAELHPDKESPLNKQDLIAEVASRAKVSKTDAAKTIDGLLDTLTETMAAGERVVLVGFGSFDSVDQPVRERRNPHTGATFEAPAKRVPKVRLTLKLS
jgi:DNA-binding protein HU-beta